MAYSCPVVSIKYCIFLILTFTLCACRNKPKEYTSECNRGHVFKHIKFTQLIDSLAFYNKQYVEVSGRYQQAKDESALFNDSLIVDKVGKQALWIDFSQECPLYLTGTRTGFFDYDNNNGQLTPANNKTITIRGEINFNNKGHLNAYKGAIDKISYVKL